jgi:hypothetical protein
MSKENHLTKKLQAQKPDKKYIDGHFKFTHAVYGELELDLALDRDNIIVVVMRQILEKKSLSVRLWGGALSAELAPHAKTRVRAIRRLRGNAKDK